MSANKCQMCGCECETTKHHLVPVSRAKNKYKAVRNAESNYVWICRSCHDFLHATYDNTELRDRLNTLESIMSDEKVVRFVAWKRKHSEFEGHAKMSNERRSRRPH